MDSVHPGGLQNKRRKGQIQDIIVIKFSKYFLSRMFEGLIPHQGF